MWIEHVLYQVQVKATGGRAGRAVSSDGVLDVQLPTPRELGGAGRRGANPEQLFAAGYGPRVRYHSLRLRVRVARAALGALPGRTDRLPPAGTGVAPWVAGNASCSGLAQATGDASTG